MSNIIDYIKWRGDLSFSKSSFNEVDGLIFSMLSRWKSSNSSLVFATYIIGLYERSPRLIKNTK